MVITCLAQKTSRVKSIRAASWVIGTIRFQHVKVNVKTANPNFLFALGTFLIIVLKAIDRRWLEEL